MQKSGKFGVDATRLFLMAAVLLSFVLMHDLFGGTLFKHNDYDSYTLQALAWRAGRLDLGQNYSWLELAVYEGKYYVSFPPVPSLVMLPLTYVFGEETPNNLAMVFYALVSVSCAYRALVTGGMARRKAAFLAAFFVMGSNLLWMSTQGGVWFQAQALNMALCLMAVVAAQREHRVLTLALVALAVGCRPFSACLVPVFLVRFYLEDRADAPEAPRFKTAAMQLPALVLPALIVLCYLSYNYARFGNPLEFGHNYLPEFSQGEAQFSLSYLWTNLCNIFRPVGLARDGTLTYPWFNGFMFFVANPFFLLFFAAIARDVKTRGFSPVKLTLIACFLLNLFLLLIHKTFGGWQFGARYTVDLLPYALLYLLACKKRDLKNWEVALGIFALLFNAYGAMAINLYPL